jgi:hypothetical protein
MAVTATVLLTDFAACETLVSWESCHPWRRAQRDSAPDTPADVQDAILPQIFSLRPGPNEPQPADRRRIQQILQGNALPGKHAADASHLSEAATGFSYFITHDTRILKRRDELHAVLLPTLTIVTLEEFFCILAAYEAGRLI